MNDDSFHYVVDSGKLTPDSNTEQQQQQEEETFNLLQAIIQYGTDRDRLRSMTKSDLLFAETYIDPDLFRLFRYKPSSTKDNEVRQRQQQQDSVETKDDISKKESYLQEMNMQPL